jgi:muconate cycloisomerase
MNITRVECHLVTLPLRRPHRWSGLTGSLGSYVLVSIETDAQLRGWGEATVLPQWGGDFGRYYGETPTTVMHVINDLFWPVLANKDPCHHQLLNAQIDRVVRGHHYAKLAVDAALLDLVAQSAQIPVYELLGGQRRSEVPMAHSIGLMPTSDAVEEAQAVVAEGMRMIKLKVGEDLDRDLEVIRKVHDTVGGEAEIAVDANQAWSPVSVAQRVISRLPDVQLRYIEQPVAGIRAMAELAVRTHIPLMADESVWTAQDMAELARYGSIPLASIYTTKAGGLHRAMQADAVAYAHGVATNVNGSDETGVGTLANIHLACAMASLGEGCVLPVPGLEGNRSTQVACASYTDDVLAQPLELKEGCVPAPRGPGWGVEIDIDKVRHYTVKRTSAGE